MRFLIPSMAIVVGLAAFGCGQATSHVVPASVRSPAAQAPASPLPSRPESSMTRRLWIAFGDSITQDAFSVDLAWRGVLGETGPSFVNAGVRGDTTANALARLDDTLAATPTAAVVGVAFGTNDVYGRFTLEAYRENMQTIVDRVKAAGKTPVLSTIPYSPDTEMARAVEFNGAIAELTRANGLPAGPDLYALVESHPEFLKPDGIHMTPEGSQAIQRAWAEAAVSLLP